MSYLGLVEKDNNEWASHCWSRSSIHQTVKICSDIKVIVGPLLLKLYNNYPKFILWVHYHMMGMPVTLLCVLAFILFSFRSLHAWVYTVHVKQKQEEEKGAGWEEGGQMWYVLKALLKQSLTKKGPQIQKICYIFNVPIFCHKPNRQRASQLQYLAWGLLQYSWYNSNHDISYPVIIMWPWP